MKSLADQVNDSEECSIKRNIPQVNHSVKMVQPSPTPKTISPPPGSQLHPHSCLTSLF